VGILGTERARRGKPQDVGMLETGDRLDLAQEPLGTDHRGKLGTQHLDRDLPVVLEVLGEVDRRHAALAQLALDRIAIGERQTEPVLEIGHEVPWLWRRSLHSRYLRAPCPASLRRESRGGARSPHR
jgi:hypothetical protein